MVRTVTSLLHTVAGPGTGGRAAAAAYGGGRERNHRCARLLPACTRTCTCTCTCTCTRAPRAHTSTRARLSLCFNNLSLVGGGGPVGVRRRAIWLEAAALCVWGGSSVCLRMRAYVHVHVHVRVQEHSPGSSATRLTSSRAFSSRGATLCNGGCNVCNGGCNCRQLWLQPYVMGAATVGNRGCNRM